MRPLGSAKLGDWPSRVPKPWVEPTGPSRPDWNGLETAPAGGSFAFRSIADASAGVGETRRLAQQSPQTLGRTYGTEQAGLERVGDRAGRSLIRIQGSHIRSGLAESVTVAEGNLRDVGDTEAAPQYRGRRQLESRAQPRLEVIPIGVERAPWQPGGAREANAAVCLIAREFRLVDLRGNRIYLAGEESVIQPIVPFS